MNKVLGYLIVVVSAAISQTHATTVREEWVARYNGPANGEDGAKALAVDGDGNVYVTGLVRDVSAYNYGTIKYSGTGNELWVALYDGPVHSGFNYAWAMTLDAARNVYVTGESYGDGTDQDYATIKYD